MDDDSKLCIICCCPFVLNGQRQHSHEVIRTFCEEIKNDVDGNIKRGEKQRKNIFESCEDIIRLEDCLRISVCFNCFPKISELVRSKENMRKLESHVINLQMEIIKGLRDLEKCVQEIKCHRDTLTKTIKTSDELFLREKLSNEKESGGLELKLREWIIQDAQKENNRKVKGDLWISGKNDESCPAEQAVVKVETENASLNFEDDASNISWDADATNQIDEKPLLKTDSKCRPNFQARKTSTMTLRARSSRKVKEEIPNQSSKPTLPKKLKRKKKPKRKQSLKPVLKKEKKEHLPRIVRQCDLCPFRCRVFPSFEQHMRHHESEANPESKSLECPHCPSKYSTQQFFDFHQKCHQGLYKLCCDICSKMIPALSLEDHLKSHISSKKEDAQKIIYCQNCYFCCTSRQTYLTHLQRHKCKITKGKFTCDICSEEFSTPKSLLVHFEEKHKEGGGTKLRCDFPNCGKLFLAKNVLTAHQKIHLKEKTIPCPGCVKKFATKCLLQKHYSVVHSDKKPFGCDSCAERFRWRDSLIVHQIKEHGAAKPKCEICKKEFGASQSLSFHMKMVHGNEIARFKCETCGKLFKRKHSLEIHLLRHGDENKFTCEQCGKGFKTDNGLKLHLKMHIGVKNWKCEYCEKAFIRKENLRDHLRVHTGERPFVCEICGKDFNQASALKTHKKNQHPS